MFSFEYEYEYEYCGNISRLWSFQAGSTKLERFLPKDQQRKVLNLEKMMFFIWVPPLDLYQFPLFKGGPL